MGKHFLHRDLFDGRQNADSSHGGAFPDFLEPGCLFPFEKLLLLFLGGVDDHLHRLAIADDIEGNVIIFRRDHSPHQAVDRAHEALDRLAIDGCHAVQHLQGTRLSGGTVGIDVTDHRLLLGQTDRLAHPPDQKGKGHRQQKAKERTGEGDDDFIQRRNRRERLVFPAFAVGLAFDRFHGRHLRQRHETAEGDGAQTVLHAVDGLLPDGFAKPDLKFINLQSPPPRRQEMAPFVHHNHEIKQHDDKEQNADPGKGVEEGGHWGNVEIMKRGAFKIAPWPVGAMGSSENSPHLPHLGSRGRLDLLREPAPQAGTGWARPSAAVAQPVRAAIQKTRLLRSFRIRASLKLSCKRRRSPAWPPHVPT